MNFKGAFLISALLHGVVIGAVAASGLRRATPTQNEERTIEMFFEVVEESACAASQEMSPEPTPPENPEDSEIQECPECPKSLESLAPPSAPSAPPAPPAPPPASASAQAEERAKVVTEATALNRITPQYPRSARRKGHEGTVTVEASISADGSISEAEIIASCGFAELDDAALSAVLSAKFAPATENGVCIDGRIRMTFDFRLK